MKNLSIVAIIILLGSCAPSRFVRPLKKDEKAVNLSLGGPLIKFAGATIPIPLTTLAFGKGVKDDLTVYGSLHTTSLLFGVFQGELGVVQELIKPDSTNVFKPGFSASFTTNFAVDKWKYKVKVWPQLDANFYWDYRKKNRNYFYVGVSNWLEFKGNRAHNEPQPVNWVWSPQVGHIFEKENWNYGLEIKYLQPNASNQYTVPTYAAPGKKGGVGVYLSLTKKF